MKKAQSFEIEPFSLFLLMPYWVYIFQSQATGRYYCGYSDNVERRGSQHNDLGYRGTRTTKIFKGPWKVIWTQHCSSQSEAMILERKIKKQGIGRYLEDRLAEFP
jgi:putative endonuclease